MSAGKNLLLLILIWTVLTGFPPVSAGPGNAGDIIPDEPASGQATEPVIDITGLNTVSFPYVLAYVTVNTSEGRAGLLQRDDFSIYENGNLMNITYFPFSESQTRAKLDLAIVFDDSGSLEDEIADLKANVKNLTTSISRSQIDCRYALISFKDTVTVRQEWTADPGVIQRAVEELSAGGGDDAPEADLDAVETALQMGFRPDAQAMILDITDERTHYRGDGTEFSRYTIPETAAHLQDRGISYILVGPATFAGSFNTDNDKRELVAALGENALFFDIHQDDFAIILERILGIITRTYTLGYYSPHQPAEGMSRSVLVTVGNDSDQGSYQTTGTEYPSMEGEITPSFADPCSKIQIRVPGRYFRPDAVVYLTGDSISIPVTGITVTGSSLTGNAEIPCDAPEGPYSVEITGPDGSAVIMDDALEITGSGDQAPGDIAAPVPEKTPSSATGTLADGGEEGAIQEDTCPGWEENSGYYLITRSVDRAGSATRMTDPWCWCNGHPYNKNYQICVAMAEP